MSRCKTSRIVATSRASVKIKDSYYTIEYSEERLVPEDMDEPTLAEEKAELWDAVNNEVDGQIADILKTFK